jgi:hypothetical protein
LDRSEFVDLMSDERDSNMKTGAKTLRARMVSAGVVTVALLGSVASIVAVGAGTSAAAETAHVTAPPSGGVYTSITPFRITDTRAGSGLPNQGNTLGPAGHITVALPTTGAAAVPAGATAVVVNITAVNATQNTYINAYPVSDTTDATSNINVYAGITTPNLAIVPLDGATSFDVGNFLGDTDVVVDLEGFFTPSVSTSGTGHFYPLNPARITDTRAGSSEANSGDTLRAGSTLNVQVTGQGGVPSAGVSAVELNVTATNTTAASYFTVWPSGVTQPTASNLNWIAGETIPNRVIVPVGSNGQVSIYNLAGSADAVVDVDGYFSTSAGSPTGGNFYQPVANPLRISDTRASSNQPNSGATLAPNSTETVQVTGVDAGGVPAETTTSPITAAILNVTEATSTQASYLTVFPSSDSTRPLASDLNFDGFVVANADIATLSPSGAVDIYNFAGNTDVAVDVFGYFTSASGYQAAVAVSPSTLVANGSNTAEVAAEVADNGSPVVGDVVTFALAGSPSAACGTLSSPTATTTSTGITNGLIYTASTTAGTCTITATEPEGNTTSTTTITQTANQVSEVVVTATPGSVTANGTDQSTVEVAVGVNGSPAASAPVVLSTLPSVAAAGGNPSSCGNLSTESTATGTNGDTPPITYIASTTPGTCTIYAATSGSSSIGTAVISQNPVVTNKHLIALTISPNSLPANGTSTSSIQAAVTDNNADDSGDTVTFTETANVFDACGTLSATTETTGTNGLTPVVTYTATRVAGECTITATESQEGATAGGTITQISSNNVIVTATPQSVSAGGTSSIVSVVGNGGSPIANDPVTYYLSGTCGALSSNTATTGSNGETPAVTYTAPSSAGSCLVTAVESGGGSGTVLITESAAPTATAVSVVATPSSLALISATSQIAILTSGAGGVPVGNQNVTLTMSGSGLLAPCGTLSASSGVTNAAGQLVVTYQAPAVVGTLGSCTITVTDTSASGNPSGSAAISEFLEL